MPLSPFPRNVFVYDDNVPEGTSPILVAGFNQYGSTSAGEFYFCLEFCFQHPQPSKFRLIHENNVILPRDATIVPVGRYSVISACDSSAHCDC